MLPCLKGPGHIESLCHSRKETGKIVSSFVKDRDFLEEPEHLRHSRRETGKIVC